MYQLPNECMGKREKFIDIKKVIADKSPFLAQWMPGFLMRYLQNTLHEEEINSFIETHQSLGPHDFCKAVIDRFEIELAVEGLAHVPKQGGCVLAANHPFGGMDAMSLICLLQGHREDIKFIVNDILLNLANLRGMFVGVNKHGRNAISSLRQVDELFGTEQAVCVFPAGLVSRKTKGKIRDLEWKKTFVTRSKRHGRPIIPVFIKGELSNFFYNLANLRKGLGIKTNLEMLYLVDEMFKQHGKKIKVAFGAPIAPHILDGTKTDDEWATEVKRQVYQLAQ